MRINTRICLDCADGRHANYACVTRAITSIFLCNTLWCHSRFNEGRQVCMQCIIQIEYKFVLLRYEGLNWFVKWITNTLLNLYFKDSILVFWIIYFRFITLLYRTNLYFVSYKGFKNSIVNNVFFKDMIFTMWNFTSIRLQWKVVWMRINQG